MVGMLRRLRWWWGRLQRLCRDRVRVQMMRMMVMVVRMVMRMKPDERDWGGARGGRSHGSQRQHVLRRAQLLGQAPRLNGSRDPVRMGHLVVHDRRRWYFGGGALAVVRPASGGCGARVRFVSDHG